MTGDVNVQAKKVTERGWWGRALRYRARLLFTAWLCAWHTLPAAALPSAFSKWPHRCMRCFPGQQRQSHLYKNVGAIVGAYLRIDIPKLPHFDQYNYVLFTGARLLDRSWANSPGSLCFILDDRVAAFKRAGCHSAQPLLQQAPRRDWLKACACA